MIATERLILRGWRDADVPAHHALVSDPSFMRHLGPTLTLADSAAAAARQRANAEHYGSCFWSVERRDTGAWIGYCGIKPGPAGTPIEGRPEIGWGIAPAHWRQGFAREAAAAALDDAWRRDLPAVFAITTPDNQASWRLMERLGMTRVTDGDFDHAGVPAGPLKRHILYRIERPA